MRVFLTGASGFVGGAVRKALLQAGHEVVALLRRPELKPALEAEGCNVVVGDIRDPTSWQAQASNCDAAIHAAQQSMGFPITLEAIAQTIEADKRATQALLDAANQGQRIKTLLYTSGLWSYGDHGDAWIDETLPYNPRGIDLRRAEREAQLFAVAHQGSIRICSIIPGNVYGPGNSFKGYVERARTGQHKIIGEGRNYMSPVHFRDAGTAYVQALSFGVSGERYNICDNNPLTAAEHAAILCEAAGGPAPGYLSSEDASEILGPLHVRSLMQSIRMSNEKAKSALQWAPRYPTFAEGVHSAIAELT